MILALFPASIAGATHEGEQPRQFADICPEGQVQDNFDDDETSTHEEAINCAAYWNVVDGTSADTYNPEGHMTRAQMAKTIANIMETAGFDLAEDPPDAFVDDETSVHELNINKLAAADVVEGGPGGRPANEFGPDLSVTRAQMASFIVRAIEKITGDTFTAQEDHFTDDEDAVPHEDNINVLADLRIVQGVGGGLYAPQNPVTREQMATFLMRTASFLAELGHWPIVPGAEIFFDVEAQQEPGGDLAAELTGDTETVDFITITGDCVEGSPVVVQDTADEDATADGIQFTIPIENDATGDCVITFEVTFDDGTTQTFRRTVTLEAQAQAQTVTDRPELVEAEVIDTNTAQETGADGTRVRFCFDEAITGAAPDATDFRVYESDATPHTGSGTATIETGGTCVVVFFAGVVTDAQAADLTVAGANEGAVFAEDNGETNAIGDAPLGEDRQETVGAAGTTDAPDLLSVGNFTSPTQDDPNTVGVDERQFTNVVFTFDETAFTVDTMGFHLVTLGNADIQCEAVEGQAGGDPDEGASPAQSGDTTIEARCPETEFGGNFTETQIARGYVDAGTVSDNNPDTGALEGEGALNPLQATETPDRATDSPDLVSAAFDPDDDAQETADEVTYTFDQDVFLGDATCPSAPGDATPTLAECFRVYDVDANEFFGATATRTTARTVVVTFPTGTLADAVGASVEEGAVEAATGANTGEANQEDEEGVENQQVTVVTSGRTAGPDLIDVDIVETNTGPVVVYTFDENVIEAGALANDGDFVAYLADGTKLVCTAATTTVGTAPTTDDNQVTCTDYNVAITGGGAATDAQIRSIVLGAVEEMAVTDDEGEQNPKGAEIVADEPQ